MALAMDPGIYIVNAILDKNEENGEHNTINFFKLSNLLYLAQGIMLAEYDIRLFVENIKFIDSGAYISAYGEKEDRLFHTKYYGGLEVYYQHFNIRNVDKKVEDLNFFGELLTYNRKKVLDYVVDKYRHLSQNELIFMIKKHEIFNLDYEKGISDWKLKKFFQDNKKTLFPDFVA